jgi:hypothetical protein
MQCWSLRDIQGSLVGRERRNFLSSLPQPSY